ncbi:hypothetical protein ALQ02_05351 [Pseudomonas savastanoi pv. phaseolicola]|nr:hypothetical protein ALQ02_05351 [Pseudomonas savastanoi pv. phaseolicola]
MQFTTLYVVRGRGASRPACLRGAWARWCYPCRRSFLTLQRGNAVYDALRRQRRRSVQTGMPTRSMGTIVLSLTTLVPHAPAWECSSRRGASQEDAERPDRHAYAEHGHDSVIPDDARSSRSSVGMQFTTLYVVRGRGASRPACLRGAWARWCYPCRRSFLTLQRGNAVYDALRRQRRRSVRTGMPTRSMGTIVLAGPPAGAMVVQLTLNFPTSVCK